MSNETTIDIAEPSAQAPSSPKQAKDKAARRVPNPILRKLASLYPQLFGASPLPLKRGIFDDIVQAQPDIPVEELKSALGEHTRSTRYLQGVAASQARHDLQGLPVEPMAAEHVFHAMVEIFRRKQQRGNTSAEEKGEASQWLARRLKHSIDASGISAQEYSEKVSTKEPTAKTLLEKITSESTEQRAKDEALLTAFDASKTSIHDFAEMYGLTTPEAGLILARARMHKNQ